MNEMLVGDFQRMAQVVEERVDSLSEQEKKKLGIILEMFWAFMNRRTADRRSA